MFMFEFVLFWFFLHCSISPFEKNFSKEVQLIAVIDNYIEEMVHLMYSLENWNRVWARRLYQSVRIDLFNF